MGLAACSSGGGESNANARDPFDVFRADVVATGITPVAQLPTMGTYDYRGLIALDLPLGAAPVTSYIGDLTLSLSFDASLMPVAGLVENLATADGATLSGTLDIDGGAIMKDADPDTQFQFTAAMGGQLSTSGVTYDIHGTITGDLYGGAGGGIAGLAFGDINTGDNDDIFDGSFAGERSP